MPISEGVNYTFWTFGGNVPGNIIRVRQGDMVELHLSNMPDSKMPHYIDLHGVTGDKALSAKVGDNIRLFVGSGGPNLVSNSHVIGEIFDKVWYEGGTYFRENVQTTLIPAGDAIYNGNRAAPKLEVVSDAATTKAEGNFTIEEQIVAGDLLFAGTCSTCHQGNGEEIAGVFPPLAKSGFNADQPEHLSEVILHGLQCSVTDPRSYAVLVRSYTILETCVSVRLPQYKFRNRLASNTNVQSTPILEGYPS